MDWLLEQEYIAHFMCVTTTVIAYSKADYI